MSRPTGSHAQPLRERSCLHGALPPTDEEWKVYCDIASMHLGKARGQLVYSAGGAPNAKQRSLGAKLVKSGRPPPCAVMTKSAFVRGIVTVFDWLFPGRYRAFNLTDFAGASQFLGGAEAGGERLAATLRGLRASSGL